MPLPRKKYFLLPLLWLALLIIGVGVLKIISHSNDATPLNWFQKKRLEAEYDRGIKILNMSMPTLDMYQSLIRINAGSTDKTSDELIEYFKQIVTLMPSMAPAYSVLGLCYYSHGSKEKAYEFFQKSFLLDPQYFWSSQNLAIMALEAHQNAEAEKFFMIALRQDPRYALKVLGASKIYSDILIADPSYSPSAALQENYLKAYQALDWLHNKKSFDPQEVGLHVRIF